MPRTTFRSVAAAAAAAAIILPVSACSAGADAEGSALTYWATNNGASVTSDTELLEASAARFTDETGIEVDVEVIPWSDLLNRIQTAITTGEGPDVVNIGNSWSASLQATGAFLEFTDERYEALGGADRWSENLRATGGAPGTTPISVPLYSFPTALWYNKAIFAEAGITDVPSTWDELLEVAEQLTVDTDGDGAIDQWGLSTEVYSFLYPLIYARQLQADTLATDEVELTSDELVEGVALLTGWISEGGIINPSDAQFTDFTSVVSAFAEGDAAIILQATGEQTFADLGLSSDEYGVASVPALDPIPAGGVATTSLLGGSNVAILAGTDQEEAALEFVAHLTSLDEATTLNQAFGAVPPQQDVQQQDAFQAEIVATLGQIASEEATPYPTIAGSAQLETALNAAIKELVAIAATEGTVSEERIRERLEQAQQEYDAAAG